jgi:hypothetical protein
MTAHCVSCHDTSTANGDLNLSFGGGAEAIMGVYQELCMNSSAGAAPDTMCNYGWAVAGDAKDSLIYVKASGVGIPPGCGVQCPQGGPYLTAAEQATIYDWIMCGEAE